MSATPANSPSSETISGIDVMRGVGTVRAKGFWADAWDRVVVRWGARFALAWVGLVAFFAVFAPVLANGLPLWAVERDATGAVVSSGSPLWEGLSATDLLLLVGTVFGAIFFFSARGLKRSERLAVLCIAALQAGTVVIAASAIRSLLGDTVVRDSDAAPFLIAFGAGIASGLAFVFVRTIPSLAGRSVLALIVGVASAAIVWNRWSPPQPNFARYAELEREGRLDATYTLVPWSAGQSSTEFYSKRPGIRVHEIVAENAARQIETSLDDFARGVAGAFRNDETWETGRPARSDELARALSGRLAESAAVAALPAGSSESDRLAARAGVTIDEIADSAVATAIASGAAPIAAESLRDVVFGLRLVRDAAREGDLERAREGTARLRRLLTESPLGTERASTGVTAAAIKLRAGISDAASQVTRSGELAGSGFGTRSFILGTDGVGKDVLSQMLHACRLSISIGLVSTGIAVGIGVFVGALMGYFGGWIDMLLSRVLEVFMAIPVLFLLIVAAAVLPRNTYVMMAIIGCVTWTGPARFIRAEFLKLRGQDFVQSAQSVGLPLPSVLFRHMLPNGVTPVLVQASFAIAAAILAEATLSYLGLGPEGQPSWGKLLASATGVTGTFLWWLAIFPGFAIFLTVFAYNLLGEAFRDAIDPKLRKAAH